MKILLTAPLLLLCTSCMSDHLFSLEGRAIVLEDHSAENPFQGANTDDIDVSGYGVHAALGLPIVDVLVGIDNREFEGEDATELTAGGRFQVFGVWKLQPFIEANLRFSNELDTGIAEDDYFGYNAGAGVMLELTESLFLNFRVVYETMDVAGNEVDGVLGTVGVGWNL